MYYLKKYQTCFLTQLRVVKTSCIIIHMYTIKKRVIMKDEKFQWCIKMRHLDENKLIRLQLAITNKTQKSKGAKIQIVLI